MSEPALQETPSASPPSLVTLRGVGAQLFIELDKDAPFEQLRDEVRRVFGETPGRFKGTTARLAFGARELSLFDLRRLVHLLKDEHEVLVSGLQLTPESLHRWAQSELKLKVYLSDLEEADEEPSEDEATVEPEPAPAVVEVETAPIQLAPPAPAPEPAPPAPELSGAHRMLPVERTVRSGTTVRFHGDIVVYGDVNAGAMVIASGNILVLGRLSGLAHAGADGDERAVVIGFDLRPTQVRIGKKIAIAPDRESAPPSNKKSPLPEIAWVSGETIVIEEYRGRLPG